jgi:hypothetical protein
MTRALALLAPLGFLAALAARPEFPIDPGNAVVLAAQGDARPLGDVALLRTWIAADGGRRLELETTGGAAPPELLVYLLDGAPGAALDALPANAILLGPLGSEGRRRFTLPATRGAPVVVLYSLARDRVLGWAALGS